MSKGTKGRPSLVSKQEIVECALAMGLAKVSMHALGKSLGVSATALYRHVESKDQLIFECCDYIMGRVDIPEQTHWVEYLYDFAANFRRALLETPGAVEFIRYNQSFTPNSLMLVDHVLGVLRNAEFDVQTGFMAFSSVFTRVTDIVQHQEQNQYLQTQGSSPDASLPNVAEFPNVALLLKDVKPLDYDAYFDQGIRITIEGLKSVYN